MQQVTGDHRYLGFRWPRLTLYLVATLSLLVATPLTGRAQQPGGATLQGQWHYLGGDAYHQRYSPLDQIHAGNFEDLEVAWIWRGNNFVPSAARGKPLFVDGVSYTVSYRRTAVAIDGGTGETLPAYRVPPTTRWERSTRRGHGKGVSWTARWTAGACFVSTPARLCTLSMRRRATPRELGHGVPRPG